MKTNISFLLLLIGLGLFGSCEKEEHLSSEPLSIEQIPMLDGKLVFDSKEELTKTIDSYKTNGKEFTEKEFKSLYHKGFRSHKPMVNKNDKELIAKFKQERIDKIKSEGHSSIIDNHLIGDKYFAAFLNDANEIIVGDKLYKYTERGLFFSSLKNAAKMREVASEKNKSSKNFTTPEICELRETQGGISEVEPGIYQYIATIEHEFDTCGGGSTSGGSGNTSGSTGGSSTLNPRYSDIALNNLIQNLDVCNGGQENWFQNLFGQYRYCHKYFNDSEYRFELDYWNQEWLIYASVGVEAETHEDGWFWWNNVDSDEIVLGINNVHLVYTLPVPDITYQHNYVQNTLNGFQSTPLYMHNGRFMIETSNSMYSPVQISVKNNTSLPFFDIKGDNVLNIYLGKFFGQDIGIQDYDIFNESNIQQIYKLGIDFLRQQGSSRKDFFATVQRNNNTIDVLYFDEKKRVYNTDEVERKFDSDWSFVVGAKSTNDGEGFTWDYSATLNSLDYLGDYKYISLDIYGLARRGNEWKGLQFILK